MSNFTTTSTAAPTPTSRGRSRFVLSAGWGTGPAAAAYAHRAMAGVCPQLGIADKAVRFVDTQPHPPRGVPR